MKYQLIVGATILLLQTPAAAQVAKSSAGTAAEPLRAEPASTSEVHTWYGWQTLTADAGSATLMGVSFAVSETTRGSSTDPAALFVGSLGAYALGAPLVHLANGEAVRAAASLGLRVGVPTLGFLAIAAAADCHSPWCKLESAAIGGLVGMLAVSAVDAAVIAHRLQRATPATQARGFSLAPHIDPTSGTYGVSVVTSGF